MVEPSDPSNAPTVGLDLGLAKLVAEEFPEGLLEDLKGTFEPRYLLRGVLGRGGMGLVLEAYDPVLERPLAIKILLPESLSSDSTARERLLREARAAATLSHPNVVSVFGVGETPKLRAPYILMQRIVGSTLERHAESGPPLDLASGMRILGDVAEALTAAHARGLVHRDLKPSNVIVDAQTGRAVVLDFGISAFAPSPGRMEAKLTGTGMYLGTPLYMSPEQAAGEPATDRSDIYSLGCMMYELLAGRRVFDGESAMVVMAAHIKDKPVPIRTFRPEVPVALERTLMSMLEKVPERRPSADDIRRQFAAVPESHPWANPRLVRARGLARSVALFSVLVSVAVPLVALKIGGEGVRDEGTLGTAALAFLACALLALCIQVARLCHAAWTIPLSYKLLALMAGDAEASLGRAVDRLQRYAGLDAEEQAELIRWKSAVGASYLLAGPVVALVAASLVIVGTDALATPMGAWPLCLLSLAIIAAVRVGSDRAEIRVLGETSLALESIWTRPIGPTVVRWLEQHGMAFGWPPRGAGRTLLVATLVVSIGFIVAAGLTLSAVQVARTGGRGQVYEYTGPLNFLKQWQRASPVIPFARADGAVTDSLTLVKAWLLIYGDADSLVGREYGRREMGYWDHVHLFPREGTDGTWSGREMVAALNGLNPRQREALVRESEVEDPRRDALYVLARSKGVSYWSIAFDSVRRTNGAVRPSFWTSLRLMSPLQAEIAGAALLAGGGRRAEAESRLRELIAFADVVAGQSRSSQEVSVAIRVIEMARSALRPLLLAQGRRAEADRLAVPETEGGNPPGLYGVYDRQRPPEPREIVKEALRDTALPPGVRWDLLQEARVAGCEDGKILLTETDPGLDSLFQYAWDSIARSPSDSAFLRYHAALFELEAVRYYRVWDHPWWFDALVAYTDLTGRRTLGTCLRGASTWY